MKLKSLKVFGFKTFAETTTLDFESGITAVVGPNGSGKSNLVDAIRWALGEQSSRSLRSQKTEDVIFAGNTKRKPLGMCEVSLTFDNTSGRMPIDFKEVQITRRAYRAGEIEYYINRNHVRLRDVFDLLSGTGLGPGSYAIVSQGQIDAILSSKPTERRALFEETAGINRFLVRKNESVRRLEQTEQNAIRLSDLLAELGRRVPELETQVRRAKRYRKVSARSRDLELLSYVRASRTRRAERESVREALAASDERQASAAAKVATLGADLATLRTNLYRHELELEELRVGAQNARAEHAEVTARYAAAHARREALEAQSSATGADEERVAIERAELDTTIASLKARLEPLARDVESKRDAEHAVTAMLAGARGTLDALFTELRTFETAAAEKAASAAERRVQAQNAEREIDRLRAEIERARERLSVGHAAASESRGRFEVGERELTALGERVEAHAASVAQFDVQGESDASQLVTLRDQLRALSSEHARDEAKLHTIEELEASLEGHIPGTRAVAEAMQRGELPGMHGVVSNLLRVDEQYARALDIAFGAGLSNVVTQTSEDAERAIAFLTQRELGRATFLPLDSLSDRTGRELGALSGREGVIGYAHTLVETAPQYRGIVAFLVGRILVVDTLPTGITLVRREGVRDSLVTLGGEQISGGGAITGGRYRRERSILARRAQAQTLRERLPKIREELEALEGDVLARTSRAEELVRGREQARRAHADAQIALTDARSRLQNLAAEIERLDAESVASHGALTISEGALEDAMARAAAIERIVDDGADASERERLESALAQARAQIARAEDEQRTAAAGVAAAREALGGTQAEHDAASARRSMLDNDAARAADAREATAREIAMLRGEDEASAVAVASIERRVATADAAFAQARTQRETLNDSAHALDGDVRMAQADERETATGAEGARRRLAEIEAELGMLTVQFAQNPATDDELGDVETRYADEPDAVLDEVPRLRDELARLSATVNLAAETDLEEMTARETALRDQLDDLSRARQTLLDAIAEIEASTQVVFNETFEKVRAAFVTTFGRLFPGGEAKMWQTDPEKLSQTGIELSVQPPGKKMMSLSALSGGERAMTAAALIFALIRVKPSPFYLLDEVDAALDEANVDRFSAMVRELSTEAQLVIVTHNKRTMELADRMYGVTMAEPGVSSIVSAVLSARDQSESARDAELEAALV